MSKGEDKMNLEERLIRLKDKLDKQALRDQEHQENLKLEMIGKG